MRIAIVGGPGVGKSTLVRQLGDLYQHGSYGEGEKGVWDMRVLADIGSGSSTRSSGVSRRCIRTPC